MSEKIVIASRNPIKINSVKLGYNKVFTDVDFEFEGVSVPSDVSDQPMDNFETLKGATNRALHAKDDYPNAKFWIGIEGGIEKMNDEMMAFAWIVIMSKNKVGKARTGTFFLPPKVVDLINQGKELGEADDIVFGHSNSKQKNGAVGILTGNLIDRTQFYVEAMVLALIPFINEKIYP